MIEDDILYRDTTSITDLRTCTYILDSETIISIGSGVFSRPKDIYKLIGNKYIKTRYESSQSDTIPSGTICLTSTTVKYLPSNFDYIVPVWYFIAIISFLFIIYLAYKIIIYPFFRSS